MIVEDSASRTADVGFDIEIRRELPPARPARLARGSALFSSSDLATHVPR